MVTGSHNPKDMNGLKLAYDGATIYGEDIQELLRMILADDMVITERGSVTRVSVQEPYLDMVGSKIRLGPRKLKVVTDSGNGTAGEWIRPLLERLGCTVTSLFDEPDGRFPNHHPDPQNERTSRCSRRLSDRKGLMWIRL